MSLFTKPRSDVEIEYFKFWQVSLSSDVTYSLGLLIHDLTRMGKVIFFNFCVNRNRDSVSYQNNRCGHILYCEKPFLVYEKAKIMYNGIILHVYIQVFIFTLINYSNKYPFSDAYNILAQCSNRLWQFFKFCLSKTISPKLRKNKIKLCKSKKISDIS